jgi:hypothetical protein
MLRRDCSGQLSVRPRPQGQTSWPVRHSPPIDSLPVGWPEPTHLPLGRHLLPGPSKTGQIPRLHLAVSGPTLAQNPLEDVANPHPLRWLNCIRKTSCGTGLGFSHYRTLNLPTPRYYFTQNSTCKPENIFLYLLIHKIRLYLWTFKRHLLPAW